MAWLSGLAACADDSYKATSTFGLLMEVKLTLNFNSIRDPLCDEFPADLKMKLAMGVTYVTQDCGITHLS